MTVIKVIQEMSELDWKRNFIDKTKNLIDRNNLSHSIFFIFRVCHGFTDLDTRHFCTQYCDKMILQ